MVNKLPSIFKNNSRIQNYTEEKVIKPVEKKNQSEGIKPPDIPEKVNGKKGLFKGSWTWKEILILSGVAVLVVLVAGVIMYFTMTPAAPFFDPLITPIICF